MDLTLVPSPQARPAPIAPDEEVVTLDDLQAWRRSGRLWRSLGRYRRARYLVHDLGFVHLPLKASVVIRLLARGRCTLEDRRGRSQRLDLAWTTRALRRWSKERRQAPAFLACVAGEVETLRRSPRPAPVPGPGAPAYLRTDLVFEVTAGGAVAHIAGMLNAFASVGPAPTFLTTAAIPTVSPVVRTVEVLPEQRFWDFKELPRLAFTHRFADIAAGELGSVPPSFLYQRYSTNNYAGVLLARQLGVPFVLEYNGSEVWIARNWGNPVEHEELCLAIEDLNLDAADLVVVVSEALSDELRARGLPAQKVLVQPNGVDPDVYRPDVGTTGVRTGWGIPEDAIVLGFIGTFGRWHGAEVLVDAVAELLRCRPDLRTTVRAVLIGDGLTMPEVRSGVDRHRLGDVVVLPGLVAQEDGPANLAACDVLVAPHVPNPDGTPFFGSPTKLFEYFATGRAVVASALDQIAEVVEHDRTGLLVRPGDPTELATALGVLVDDPVRRARLGAAAREEAVARHSWAAHAGRVLDAIGVDGP